MNLINSPKVLALFSLSIALSIWSYFWLSDQFFVFISVGVVLLGFIAWAKRNFRTGILLTLLLANIGYWLVNIYFTYGNFSLLTQPEFLSNDGRMLILYPLLFSIFLLAQFLPKRNLSFILRSFLIVPAILSLAGIIQYLAGWDIKIGNEHIYLIRQDIIPGGPVNFFHGLHNAHNAAGIAYGAATLAATVGWVALRNNTYLLLLLLIAPAWALTYSKSSMIGFGIALIVAVFFLVKNRALSLIRIILAAGYVAAMLGLTFVILPNFFNKHQEINRTTGLVQNLETVYLPEKPVTIGTESALPKPSSLLPSKPAESVQTPPSGQIKLGFSAELPNNSERLELAGDSIAQFKPNPIFGIGFGRFNDTNDSGKRSFLGTITEADIVNSQHHAHDSYLQILVETGLVGLGLLLGFYLYLGYCLVRTALYSRNDIINIISLSSLVLLMVGSLFEHNLAAPSSMLALMIFISLSLAEFEVTKPLIRSKLD